jgi:hypothetical protein
VKRSRYKGLTFTLERHFNCKVVIASRVDAPTNIIVVLDLPELPADAERFVKSSIPAWLSFSVWTYGSLRDIARDPNSRVADLVTAAHVLPKSVQTNAIYDLIALEDPLAAERLRDMLG